MSHRGVWQTFPVALLLTAALAAGCQYLPGRPQPARLVSPEQPVRQQLQQHISRALGRPVVLSGRALTESARLTISAPVPAAGNPAQPGFSLSRPDHFSLSQQGDQCVLTHEQSGQSWELTGARCAAIP